LTIFLTMLVLSFVESTLARTYHYDDDDYQSFAYDTSDYSPEDTDHGDDDDKSLGLLEYFNGVWKGYGFNVISLPDFDRRSPSTGPKNYRVLASETKETLTFTSIGGPVANRGSLFRRHGNKGQKDINLYGFTYLQQISDANSGAALHVEPGIWVHVPASNRPHQNETYVRMASVPHGDSVLAQSLFASKSTNRPIIDNASSLPTGSNVNSKFLKPFYNCKLPEGVSEKVLFNPNQLLSKAIKHQTITETVVIGLSTSPVGGIVNIPFVQANANATQMNAVFWIETVEREDGSTFLQLQYTQTVLLNFIGVTFPHITVATLVKEDV